MFQNVGAKALVHELGPRTSSVADEAAELIARYPNLSEVELARLINLYRELSALDMALMISDDELAPKLDHFFNNHARQLRTPFRQYAVLVGIAVAGIIVVAWAAIAG